MGAATRRRREFLKTHTQCAFCGGNALASSIEHCPPRAMFQFREWPEGFEFPSCESCNGGTSNQDLLVTLLARMDPFHEMGDRDEKLQGLIFQANRQFPGLIKRMLPSPTEARINNRRLGISPQPGQTHQEAGAIKIPEEFHEAVCIFASKLGKGIFYQQSQKPFPNDGCLIMNWFTNTELFQHGKYITFESLKNLTGHVPLLARGGKFLNDQFEYKLSLTENKEIFVIQAKFGKAFGILIVGSSLRGQVESIINALREKTARNGPFTILQSPILR